MPLRDKTGPLGKGARTGRGLGDCDIKVDKEATETKTAVRNLFGRGRGMGRGRRILLKDE